MEKEILLVDGYNILHASPEMARFEDLSHARDFLVDRLAEYQAIKGCRIIVVFDAHQVKGGQGSVEVKGNVEVIFSPEGRTADSIIEEMTSRLAPRVTVTVATSDAVEQGFVFGKGASRKPARELWLEIAECRNKSKDYAPSILNDKKIGDLLDEDIRKILEDFRRRK